MKFIQIKLSMAHKLLLSFGMLIFLVLTMAFIVFFSLSRVKAPLNKLTQDTYPLVLSAGVLESSLNYSLASLRGQIILGSDPTEKNKFIGNRENAWQDISKALIQLTLSAEKLGYSKTNINELKQLLEILETAQQQVSIIANSPENEPAHQLLITEAMPIAERMLDILSQLINIESEQEADDERRMLLKFLADSQGTFAISISNLRAFLLTNEQDFEHDFNKQWLINADAYNEIVDEYEELLTETQTKLWQQYSSLREKFAPLTIQTFERQAKEDANIANYKLRTVIEPAISQVLDSIDSLRKFIKSTSIENQDEVTHELAAVNQHLFVISAIALILSLIISGLLIRNLKTCVNQLLVRANDISSGNLVSDGQSSTKESVYDELSGVAYSFHTMASSLVNIIQKIKAQSKQVEHSSHQVATLADQIVSVADKESKGYLEIKQATDSFMFLLRDSQQVVDTSRGLLVESNQHAKSGLQAVAGNIEEMDKMVNVAKEASNQVHQLKEVTAEISTVTDAIHAVADQTNLLSLNAAIEAARAGEHGRGFAVVADEVRSLAIRTSNSTEEIKNSISALISNVESVVVSMERIIEQVNISKLRSEESGNSFTKMANSMESINTSNEKITVRSEDQLVQMEELQDKLGALFKSLTENSEKAQLVSIISNDLNRSSGLVRQSLSFFSLPPQCIKYDDIYNKGGKRATRRLDAKLLVTIQQGTLNHTTISRDFSLNGLNFNIPNELNIDYKQGGPNVTLSVFTPQKSASDFIMQQPITLKGAIQRKNLEQNSTNYGVEFVELTKLLKEQLKSLFDYFEQ